VSRTIDNALCKEKNSVYATVVGKRGCWGWGKEEKITRREVETGFRVAYVAAFQKKKQGGWRRWIGEGCLREGNPALEVEKLTRCGCCWAEGNNGVLGRPGPSPFNSPYEVFWWGICTRNFTQVEGRNEEFGKGSLTHPESKKEVKEVCWRRLGGSTATRKKKGVVLKCGNALHGNYAAEPREPGREGLGGCCLGGSGRQEKTVWQELEDKIG